MDKNKVIEKIKALLSLGTSDNPNEAALALKRARQLMNKHGITSDQIVLSDIREKVSECTIIGKDLPVATVYLIETIAALFQCTLYYNRRYRERGSRTFYQTSPVFVGINPNEEICIYTYEILIKKLNKARRSFRPQSRNKKKRALARLSFANGWVHAVCENVQHIIPDRPKAQVDRGYGLVKVDALEAYMDSKNFEEEIKTKVPEKRDHFAELVGYMEGQKIQVNKGVAKTDQLCLD